MSLLDNFILDLEENGYYLFFELTEALKFRKGNYECYYNFLINKNNLNIMFSGVSGDLISIYKINLNKNMKVATFHSIANSVVNLSRKRIGISVNTHRCRRKNEDTFHFRLRPNIYETIPNQIMIDQEEPVLSEFRNCLHELTEETNCNFYAEPWKAFKLLPVQINYLL